MALESQVRVFVGFLHLPSYITNWGSGLVPVYVEKSGSGLVRVLDSRGWDFAGFLKTRYITRLSPIFLIFEHYDRW